MTDSYNFSASSGITFGFACYFKTYFSYQLINPNSASVSGVNVFSLFLDHYVRVHVRSVRITKTCKFEREAKSYSEPNSIGIRSQKVECARSLGMKSIIDLSSGVCSKCFCHANVLKQAILFKHR